ncbi:hypothetical protein ABPG77_009541 [Micractinium sp. CCAP 211/92]
MPRRQLLVAGFRNLKLVSRHLKHRKAAQISGYATWKHAAPAKAAAPGAAKATPGQLKQPGAQRGTHRDGTPAAPSFAASGALSGAATPGPSGGLLGGFSLKSAATALGLSKQQSPSFAAAPLWGKPAAAAAAARPAVATQQAGAPAVAAGVKKRSRMPAAVSRDPLYRLAKLDKQQAATAQAPPQQAEQGGLGALGRYARLAGQQSAKPAGAGEGGSKALAGLLKLAKLAGK